MHDMLVKQQCVLLTAQCVSPCVILNNLQANALVRTMITKLGYGKSLGLLTADSDGDTPALSDSAAQRVEQEIKVHYSMVHYK
jgi:hypothetical protein